MKGHFLIRTKLNGHAFQKTWNGKDETVVGHPALWKIENTSQGVQVTHYSSDGEVTKSMNVPREKIRQGVTLKLPAEVESKLGPSFLEIEPAASITPVFRSRTLGSQTRTIQLDPSTSGSRELFVFTCFGEWVVESEPLIAGYIRKGYIGYYADRPAFQISKKKGTYTLFAHATLRLQQGLQLFGLERGKSIPLSEEQLKSIKIHVESCHWRFSHVPSISLDHSRKDTVDAQTQSYNKILGLVFGVVTLGLFVLNNLPEPKIIEKVEQDVKLEIEQPKIVIKAPEPELPKKEEPKKPEPKPEPKQEAPKTEPKKIEKPKPAAPAPVAAKPKPMPAPPKQVAPPPKVIPPPQAVAPPPVQAPPKPVAPDPAVVAAQQAAAQQAQQKQMLAKSLGFLSGAKSNISIKAPAYQENVNPGAYDNLAKTPNPQAIANTALTQMSKNASANGASGPISTQSSRNINSDAAVAGYGKGKSLNEVQGRVAGVGGSGAGFGKGFGSGGATSVSGPGKLSADAINAALKKIEEKLRFCYEKGLLSNPNLSGSVKIEWTIQPGGNVSGAKIINSQINNPGVNSCLTGVINGAKFDSPQGGAVTVDKVFSFSSSAM